MKGKQHTNWYKSNKNYSDFLDNQNEESFDKYVDFVRKYLDKSGSFLDVGCGTGIALNKLREHGYGSSKLRGLEVSKTSLDICRHKKLNCTHYEGAKLPFKSKSFDVVGSINVLVHTDYPVRFLNEKYRVVRKGGYILVVCPNFLSLTNNYHHHTRGPLQKIKNAASIIKKSISPIVKFEKMAPVQKEVFEPDDDAVNATNPIDILNWAKSKKLDLVYWSSQQQSVSKAEFFDFSILRLVFGSCFFVFRKI